MQQNNLNQSNNNQKQKPSPLNSEQVTKPKKTYIVDVSIEMDDCMVFVEWLKSNGHHASIVDSECSFINGTPVFCTREQLIFNHLRLSFRDERLNNLVK